MKHFHQTLPRSRRCFLQGTSLLIASSVAGLERALAFEDSIVTTAGLITDLHYADKDPSGTRYYRETLAKLDEAARQFDKPETRPCFLVELGELVDAARTRKRSCSTWTPWTDACRKSVIDAIMFLGTTVSTR